MRSNDSLDRVTIYTIGHSNIELERFLRLLDDIEAVVDVRSMPFSKYASQFNTRNIKIALELEGRKYIFIEDKHIGNVLGGKPRDKDCYEDEKVVYEKIMRNKWYKKGISELIKIASKEKTAIMCSEEDPYKCHRHHLISQSLLKEGVRVFHIRRDGNLEEANKEKRPPKLVTLLDYS